MATTLYFATKSAASKLYGAKDYRTWLNKGEDSPCAKLVRSNGKIAPLFIVDESAAEKLSQQKDQ